MSGKRDLFSWSLKRADIERFVAIKIEQMKTRVLAWDPDDYTKEVAGKGSEDNATKRDENGGAESQADGRSNIVSDELT